MAPTLERRISIFLGDAELSGLLATPANARACYVLAHGARVGMQFALLAAIANGLFERNVATLRFQFPFMEEGRKNPDAPKRAQATVRAAVREAARLVPHLPLIAGGKSWGARMTSEAQAEAPLANVRALVFMGYQLRLPGQTIEDGARHLSSIEIPMLFLLGERDELAEPLRLKPVVERLGSPATLKVFNEADEWFRRTSHAREHADMMPEMLDTLAAWIDTTL